MPIRFFVVDANNVIIIFHITSTHLGLLKVLYHNRATQHRHLDPTKKHTFQQDDTSTTSAVYLYKTTTSLHPFQDHSTTVPPLQDYKTTHNIED